MLLQKPVKFVVHNKTDIYHFFYHHWANTSAGGLLVPDGIILPVVSVLALTWLYEKLKNLEILNLGWFIPAKYSL